MTMLKGLPLGDHMLHHPADKRFHRDGFVLQPLGPVRAIMVRDPRAIIAINAPDGDRRTHHVLRHVARQTLVLRGDLALLHVGHQTIGVFPETPIHQLVDRLRLECLAHHAQEVPLPCATQELVGQVREMLPARSLGIIPPAGGEQMPMGMVTTTVTIP